jgi:hypothetical protein
MTTSTIHIDRLMLAVLTAKTAGSSSGYGLATIEDREDVDSTEGFKIQFRTYGGDAYGWHDFDRLTADALRDTVKAADLKPYYRPDEPRPEVILVVPDEVLGAIWSDSLPRDAVKLPNGRYDSRNPFVSAALHTVSTYYQTLHIVPLSAILTLTGPWAADRKWATTLAAIKATMAALDARLSAFDLPNARTMPAPLPVGPFFDHTELPSRDAFDFGSIFAAGVAWQHGEIECGEEAA